MWALAALMWRGRRDGRPAAVAAPLVSVPVPVADAPARRRARLPARGDTAVIRCLNTYGHLSPDDDSDEAIRQWLADLGEDDADPAMIRADLQALGWWPKASPAAASLAAPVAPSPAPAAEPAAPVAPRLIATEKSAEVVQLPGGKVTLSPADAAARFLEWASLTGRSGSYSSDELTQLYIAHCEAEDLVPLTDNVLRPELERAGARKVQVNCQAATRHGGSRRQRYRRWTLPEASNHTVPWDDLPERKAA